MRLLLDTHILLWSLADPQRLSLEVRRVMVRPGTEVNYSAVSLFEIASKRAAGRRGAPAIQAERVWELAEAAGYSALGMMPGHAIAAEAIAPFHGDPFDRLLLATAQVESLRLVTHDEQLAGYDPRTILC